ncbi:MAG TPA: DUF3553 domain-containing protein, partial [Alphaproteobacteria bacterium]|nr:DUF3553 domain-containing protein [Alphaproteobacteria bacterium]
MQETLVPGALVRHPDKPEWGLGQVQTVIDNRITVNFEHQGKVLINGDVVALEIEDD